MIGRHRAVFSWVLYDFANTIFSVSILSYFFPLWLGDELGAGPGLFNYLTAGAMLLVVLTAPVFGAIADLKQRRKPYLVLFTLAAVVCTAALDFFGTVVGAAVVFVAANFAYQSAIIFYNALLPVVAREDTAGRISGYGGAAGYISTILALFLFTFLVTDPGNVRNLLGPLGWWIETKGPLNSNTFVPTAISFLLFSLPVMLLVPDYKVRPPRPAGVKCAYRNVYTTLREVRQYAGLGTFLIATILYMDAANTVVSNMALYGREVFGMAQGEIRNLLLLSTVFAGLGALGFGLVTDRIGPKRALTLVLLWWLVAILLVAASTRTWMLLAAGPLVGVAFGATGSVSRVMLLALSPPEKVGEFFGFYGLAGRFSAVTGPALTGLILTSFGGPGSGVYRLAVLSLAVVLGLGLLFLLRVPDRRPNRVVTTFSGRGE